ncbi:MAG TPA: HAMP domain-containing sensor histidine kinase [Armatimonadota bacterium]|jgi:signal transduction histidine kinase
MSHRKPTLAAMLVRHHLWAAALTLGLVMLCLLVLADLVNLRVHRSALANRLRTIETVDAATSPFLGIYSHTDPNQISYILLDGQGRWRDGATATKRSHRVPAPRWARASSVFAQGELAGRGELPWVTDPVIWAARRMQTPDGKPMLMVAWYRVNAIRANTIAVYGAVVVAILLAFAVSVTLALRTAKSVTTVIDEIAKSSSRMAAGDYRVQLPVQPTRELDHVSRAITQLADNLDHTSADLHAEHARLERMERLQRQFVADASHELRAPLTSMRVTLEAWQDGVLRPGEQQHALAQLLRETERLGTLVSRLLDLSRIESGREGVTSAPVSVRDVAYEILMAFTDPTGASLVVEMPDDLPPALADRDALYRILQNLVENARRFTPVEGTITISAVLDGEAICLRVADTGCGIAAEELPRIWDRFARAAEARAQGKAGSGLGLAIVKGLTTAMDGQVGVESVPGQGMTVWVRLPRAVDKLSCA